MRSEPTPTGHTNDTRDTRGPFWSIRPAKVLWLAVVGTQTLATLIVVYGVFMAPLGWGWAACVWAYALAWALFNDRVKLAAYGVLDRIRAGETARGARSKVAGDLAAARRGEAITAPPR